MNEQAREGYLATGVNGTNDDCTRLGPNPRAPELEPPRSLLDFVTHNDNVSHIRLSRHFGLTQF